MKALSIRQPWAWLIANGFKDVENRCWGTSYRGRFYIHAGGTYDPLEWVSAQATVNFYNQSAAPRIVLPRDLEVPYGGIVGDAILTDCVEESRSVWFCGPKGFLLVDARSLPFQRVRGMPGFFFPQL